MSIGFNSGDGVKLLNDCLKKLKWSLIYDGENEIDDNGKFLFKFEDEDEPTKYRVTLPNRPIVDKF